MEIGVYSVISLIPQNVCHVERELFVSQIYQPLHIIEESMVHTFKRLTLTYQLLK